MAAIATLQCFRIRLSKFVASDSAMHSTMLFDWRGVTVYVRRAWHPVDGELYVCLDIANVAIRAKRRGTFKLLLGIAQDVCPWHAVRVECVGNKHLAAYLRRLAADDVRWFEEPAGGSPNFVWFKDREGEYTTPSQGGRKTREREARSRAETPSLAAVFKAMRMASAANRGDANADRP